VLTGSSLRSRWTLVVAVAASAVLLTGTVLFLRRGGSPSPAAAHASPSELPSADPSPVPTGAISVLPASSPAPQTTPPRPKPRPATRATFWSPEGPTGEISIKYDTPVTLSRVIIRGAAGGGAIQAWRLSDHDTGDALASGTGAGSIAFAPRRLRKITFEILRADGTPRVAEFETYGG
jgi:pectate lyase